MSCPRQRDNFGGRVEVSISFPEIVHIRRTVTEADLSSLQEEDEQLFNLINTGKVCDKCSNCTLHVHLGGTFCSTVSAYSAPRLLFTFLLLPLTVCCFEYIHIALISCVPFHLPYLLF